ANARSQQKQNARNGFRTRSRFPTGVRHNRQPCQGNEQQRKMQPRLMPGPKPGRDKMGIGVASEQQHLKKKQTGRPHPRTAAKPRQDVFSNQRLDLKQEKGADKYSEREKTHA